MPNVGIVWKNTTNEKKKGVESTNAPKKRFFGIDVPKPGVISHRWQITYLRVFMTLLVYSKFIKECFCMNTSM